MMKVNLILIFILLPFMTSGQSRIADDVLVEKNVIKESILKKETIRNNTINQEGKAEMTLINDTEKHNEILKYDIVESHTLSLTNQTDKKNSWIDENKLEKIILNIKPLIDYKFELMESTEPKRLFDKKSQD